jgi:hypothetical protein
MQVVHPEQNSGKSEQARMISGQKLKLIHVARGELDLSEEAYRQILSHHAGVQSAKDLDDGGFKKFHPLCPTRHHDCVSSIVTDMQTLFKILSTIPEFIAEVLTSWAGYLTGGVIMAAWWVWERRFDAIPWKYVRFAIVGFLLVAFFSAWYEKREAFSKAHSELEVARGKLQEANFKVENRDTTISLLENQIQNQQRTINDALVQLGKAQQQEPLKLTHHPLGRVEGRHKHGIAKSVYEFIVLTNKLTTPVKLVVACDGEIVDLNSKLLGASGLMTGGLEKINQRQYLIGISSPAWTPSTPLLVTVYSDKEIACSFAQS